MCLFLYKTNIFNANEMHGHLNTCYFECKSYVHISLHVHSKCSIHEISKSTNPSCSILVFNLLAKCLLETFKKQILHY